MKYGRPLMKVLGNAEKRALYDKYGLEGVKSGGGMGGGMDDLFEMFGGGGRRGGAAKKQKRKVQPTEKEISVTLEDIFSGKALKLDNDKQINCPDCNGKGGEGVNECGDCKGRGFVMKMQQLGPGMYTQSQAACPKCKGQGEVRWNKAVDNRPQEGVQGLQGKEGRGGLQEARTLGGAGNPDRPYSEVQLRRQRDPRRRGR